MRDDRGTAFHSLSVQHPTSTPHIPVTLDSGLPTAVELDGVVALAASSLVRTVASSAVVTTTIVVSLIKAP